MSHIKAAIESLEQERADLYARVHQIDAAIDAMRPLLPPGSVVEAAAESKPDRRAYAPRAAFAQHLDAIRKALKGGPLAPREVCEKVGVPYAVLRRALDRLLTDGEIAATGQRAGRRLSLMPGKPAKEVP